MVVPSSPTPVWLPAGLGCAVVGASAELPQVGVGEEEGAVVTQIHRALSTRWGEGRTGTPAACPWGHLLLPHPGTVDPRAGGYRGPGEAGDTHASARPRSTVTLFPAR